MEKPKFITGSVFTTNGIATEMEKIPLFSVLCQEFLNRHRNGDWGDLVQEDKELNEEALLSDGRLLSSYNLNEEMKSKISSNDVKVYIITEWDRSATTILFPSEY